MVRLESTRRNSNTMNYKNDKRKSKKSKTLPLAF